MGTPKSNSSSVRHARQARPWVWGASGVALCIGCVAWIPSCAADVGSGDETETDVAASQLLASDKAPGTLVWAAPRPTGHVCNEGLHLLQVLELRQDSTWLYVGVRHRPAIEDESAPVQFDSATFRVGFEGDTLTADMTSEGMLRSDTREMQWVQMPLDTLPSDTLDLHLQAFGARVTVPIVSDGTHVRPRSVKDYKGAIVEKNGIGLPLPEDSLVQIEKHEEVSQ